MPLVKPWLKVSSICRGPGRGPLVADRLPLRVAGTASQGETGKAAMRSWAWTTESSEVRGRVPERLPLASNVKACVKEPMKAKGSREAAARPGVPSGRAASRSANLSRAKLTDSSQVCSKARMAAGASSSRWSRQTLTLTTRTRSLAPKPTTPRRMARWAA